MSSALQAVVESYTSEVLMHKKHRLLDIIVGARATASDVLEPKVVQVREGPSNRLEGIKLPHHRCKGIRQNSRT